MACDNLAGWPTVSKVHFATYRINTSGAVVAGTQIDWYGIVSGNNIGSMTRITGATDAGHSIGDVVEMMPTGSWAQGLYDWGTTEHDKNGTHTAVTATSLTNTGNYSQTGGTFSVPSNAITAAALSTSAITLGYAQITAVPTANNSGTQAAVSGLGVTVTIPAGGRKVKITAYAPTLSNDTVNGQSLIAIWDGTVGSGTQLTSVTGANNGNAGGGGANGVTAIAVVTPSAGSKTYNVGLSNVVGSNAKINNVSATSPAFILVETI